MATAHTLPCGGDRPSDAALERDLRAALAAGELGVVYQPKLNLRSGEIDAVEALCRWTHPDHGPIPPDHFIQLAEANGDIELLTRQVLARAQADRDRFVAAGWPDLTVFVNLSGRLVTDEAFTAWLLEVCGPDPRAIGLEITETAVITDPERAIRNLTALADAGVLIAIDDYGSGLSSLAYLRALPARDLKIDRTFVSGLRSSPRDPLIVRSTVDLAHALDMSVTAEGVEDAGALALLRLMGCDHAQGFHISAPLQFDAMLDFLRASSPAAAAPPAAAANGRRRA